MTKILENLINNKYYSTKEEVEQKLNVFFAFNVLTQEEYTKLMQLVEEKYKESVVEDNKQEEATA
ncbi:hypothetical protein [Clostridium sp. HMSC19A10]|uniref:hypothetical protein n=1 Tax=Clostridium sp. HMSC19A10 TaxID=1581148 RepID=UPI0008A27A9D|nr:hypothetical protein [Clostridium sp. HMSC19A10]OFS22986.1 hypothetical protein HMPREF3070_09525 [Clostridium sp. HMSC19A10]